MIATAKNILVLFVLLIIILYIFWSSISTGRIKEYLDETGNEIPNSLSEKSLVEINGVNNGFFINSRNPSNPVLLFVSSGPGTDDYFFNEKYKDMHLDDIFTIIYWDYRGMGIAYDSEINPEEITTKVLVEDTKKVTEYLKTRFKQDKIYIMGFSGGTNIAIRAVQENPEDYNCPWPLVREYCEKLEAPEKDFYLIKNAAHSPLWENASDSFQIMGEIKERTQDER